MSAESADCPVCMLAGQATATHEQVAVVAFSTGVSVGLRGAVVLGQWFDCCCEAHYTKVVNVVRGISADLARQYDEWRAKHRERNRS